MPGIKLSNAPYSPEFNPIERLFRSMKYRFPDLKKNESMYKVVFYMIDFNRYDMTADLIKKF